MLDNSCARYSYLARLDMAKTADCSIWSDRNDYPTCAYVVHGGTVRVAVGSAVGDRVPVRVHAGHLEHDGYRRLVLVHVRSRARQVCEHGQRVDI